MRNRMRFLRSFVVLALFIFPLLALGQVTKGSISGTVADASGAVIQGALVQATDTQTGAVLKATTDRSGNFHFSLIPPGQYQIEIDKAGFQAKTVIGIFVHTSQDSGLGTLALAVAGGRANVEVSASYTPLIETTQSQIANTFSTEAITSFAGVNENEGLDYLALLLPGVNASRDNDFANYNGVNFSVNGIRGRNNDQQIDGQNNNDNSVGGPVLGIGNGEFVDEYQVITDNFGPEYGRNGGSVVNIVTKSGTNNLHGSIFGTENNSVLNTLTSEQKRFDDLTKPPRLNQEFGGFTLGGPVVKNKVFFFEGFDEQLYREASLLHTDLLTPTTAGLAQLGSCPGVDANALTALQTYSPYAFSEGAPFPTKATSTQVTIGDNTCNVEMGGVTRSVPNRLHEFDWLNKVDYQTGQDSFTLRYLYQRNNWFDEDDNGAGGWFYNQPGLSQQVKAGWTRQLTSNLVNEFSVSYGRENASFGGSSDNSDPTVANLNKGVTHIGFLDGTSLAIGPATNLPQGRIIDTWQLQDNLNYQLGKHHLKAGINWTYQRSINEFLPYINGRYRFSGWSAFLTNSPSSINIANGNSTLDFREYDTFAYVGDDWKFNPNLTFNFGLTYSFYGQPANLFHTNDVKLQTGSNPLWDPTLPLSVTTSPTLPSDKTSFGPSIGFAWTPKFLGGKGNTVIRGGYRLAYDPPVYNVYTNMSSSAPQVFLQTISSRTTNIAGTLPANPTGPNVRNELASYLTLGVSDPRTFAQTDLSKHFQADQIHSWSLGLQREVTKNAVAEVRYVGNHAGHQFQSINANPYLAGLQANFPGLIPSGITLGANGRIDGDSSIVRERANTGYSDYNGLQTEFRADDLFHQLLIRTSYTWSKTTDNSSEIAGTGAGANTSAFSQNPLNFKGAEHALSGLDVPHNWTLNFVEQIPAYKSQQGLVGHLLGGWSVAGTYFIASGQTYSPTQSSFDYNSGYSDNTDYVFNGTFSTTTDGLRPFWGNRKAKATSVGAYAGDVYAYAYSNGWDTTVLSATDPTQLIDYGVANATANNSPTYTPTVTPITKDNVRYILNSTYAQQAFGSPWGNVPRNAARDFWTNTANAAISKNLKLNNKVQASLRATFTNAFNHPNYSSIDPYVDDAGLQEDNNGFGDPTLFSGGSRTIYFGSTIRW